MAAAVPFYGVGPALPDTYTGLRAAVQGHYGLRDAGYPPDQARALADQIRRESGANVEFHFYDAGHAFLNQENRSGTYDPEQAAIAWARTVAFLRDRLDASAVTLPSS